VIDYDPYAPEALRDPLPLYRELRREAPVYPLPQYDGFALSRFEDVWQVISDRVHFTIVEGPVFFPPVVSVPFEASRLPPYDPRRSFASWDPPIHTQLRARIHKSFTPRAAARLEADARRIARDRLRELAPRGRFDVVRDLASPVAVTLSCLALGVPEEDGPHLVELSNLSARREEDRAGMTEQGVAAQAQIHEHIHGCVTRRRAGTAPAVPRVMDALLETELDGHRLSDVEIAIQLTTLLVGGSETVPKITAGGVRELAQAPEQRAALAKDPGLLAGAFEEIVRHQGVLQSVGRTALEPVEVAGVSLTPGQRLFLLLQSANRDEREFSDPDRFDIRRRPERHLGFGHGPHHCPGAHLARMEGRVLLDELLRCIPEWEVDPDSIERPPSEFQIGFTSLSITFDARSAEARLGNA
jgi:cytochrome P450